jgi:hypothetical protein
MMCQFLGPQQFQILVVEDDGLFQVSILELHLVHNLPVFDESTLDGSEFLVEKGQFSVFLDLNVDSNRLQLNNFAI